MTPLDVPAVQLAPLIEACNKYPYHELVAYACGYTIGELREWLETGAAAGDDQPNLREFARDYCQADAEYARETFELIRALSAPGSRGDPRSLWKWFDTRWPCDNPIAITTILAGQRTEALTLEQMFRDPSQPVRDALRETSWFSLADLDNPSQELTRALEGCGYRRDDHAGPTPRPPPTG
jgi:hypothetical protein